MLAALGGMGFACNAPEPAAPQVEPNAPVVPVRQGVGVAAATPTPSVAPIPAPSHIGWNEGAIQWTSFAAGQARARAEHKPMLVVFHADWCGHCRNYSHVFEDPRVVERARDLVMVRVNVDEERDVASRFAVDGTYVPRTYFVAPDGTTMAQIDAHRSSFRYFFDEHDAISILGGMNAAVAQR